MPSYAKPGFGKRRLCSHLFTGSDSGFSTNGDSEWFLNEIMKNALQQNYNLNISGGSKTLPT